MAETVKRERCPYPQVEDADYCKGHVEGTLIDLETASGDESRQFVGPERDGMIRDGEYEGF